MKKIYPNSSFYYLALNAYLRAVELFIKTLAGLEPVLADELTHLGATAIVPLKRAVRCEGDQRLLYRANLELRTALRVLVTLDRFQAQTEADVYAGMQRTDWSRFLQPDQTLAIDVVTFSNKLDHGHYLALKCKDAIVDQFREKTGERPSVDTRRPDLRIHLHLDATGQATLSLDSSGEGLHRRGYRQGTGHAPINEVLAAGLVALSGWQGDTPFVDPLCGSGTILIEAAYVARRQPPNWHRRRFGFHSWPDYQAELWQSVRDAAAEQMRPHYVPIVGGDRAYHVLEKAKQNIAAAKVGEIELRKIPFQQFVPPPPVPVDGDAVSATLITNPPYNLRMQTDDIAQVYQDLGDKFKQDFAGYTAWVFSGNPAALKRVGLRPSRKITLYNGPVECKYFRYDLYAGSRKKRKRIVKG